MRYSLAPAFIASTACATLPCAVSMMIGNAQPLARSAAQDLHAVRGGHPVVEHHDVGLLLGDGGERLLAVGGLDDLEALGRERLAEHPAHVLLVVDDEHALAHAVPSHSSIAAGSDTVNVVPAWLALDFDMPVMLVDDAVHDRQTRAPCPRPAW